MSNKNVFITGNTDLLILSVLKKEDSYAYDIVRKIDTMSDGMLNLSNNTIYTAIYKLEDKGYITEYSKLVGRKRTRVYYHLEEPGYVYLEQLLETYLKTMEGTNMVLRKLDCI